MIIRMITSMNTTMNMNMSMSTTMNTNTATRTAMNIIIITTLPFRTSKGSSTACPCPAG